MDSPCHDLMINEIVSSLTLARSLIEDALIILQLIKKEGTLLAADYLTSYCLNSDTVLSKFSYPEELLTILTIAEKYFSKKRIYPVNPFALMLAIRESERGRKGLEFGVMHPESKNTDLCTQADWACGTVKKNFERFCSQEEEKDFIVFLGKRYAPIGAENDPKGLNQYWVENVRYWHDLFSQRKD